VEESTSIFWAEDKLGRCVKKTVNWADEGRNSHCPLAGTWSGVQNVDAAGGAGNGEREGPLKAQLQSADIYKTLTASSLRPSSQVPAATSLSLSSRLRRRAPTRYPHFSSLVPCLLVCETEFPNSNLKRFGCLMLTNL